MIRIFALVILVTCLTGCEKKRTPERHIIPFNYEGVLFTIFNQEGFDPLPVEGGFRVFEYPSDGILITSSLIEYGSALDETLDTTEDGNHRKLSSGNIDDRREHFTATGWKHGLNKKRIDYAFKVVGSVKYMNSINSTEYDKKEEEAFKKLAEKVSGSEQGGSSNGG